LDKIQPEATKLQANDPLRDKFKDEILSFYLFLPKEVF